MQAANAFRERITKQIHEQKTDPYYEIRQQVRWLEQEIAREMSEFRTFSHELKSMKQAVGEFVADYCLEVGEYAERLKGLGEQLEAMHVSCAEDDSGDEVAAMQSLMEEMQFSFSPKAQQDISNEDVKRLYRKLAKVMHPDTTPSNPKATEMFALLNASYISQDMSMLEYLKVEFLGEDEMGGGIPEESPMQKLERLEQEYDAIRISTDRVRQEKHTLSNSAGYKLQQYVCWYKMCGDDLLARIKERMKGDIRRKELMLAGLEHAAAGV